MKKYLTLFFLLTLFLSPFQTAQAQEELACVSTTWRVVNNDKVCVKAFKDPDIDGIVCHLSYAKTGGISGALGVAENPSRFALSCHQVGPLKSTKGISPKKEKVFTQKMSFLFKDLNITRLTDIENNAIIYLVLSEKIIDGSPYNSLSTVPLMPWNGEEPLVIFNKK
ncbi:CreA family protein [Pelistega sp. NLN82]|uniref:CreA family protein n=1 Tax=Pelistega ratti TaxID=2652177 RepID=A0A6L9Y503_9BURK|nr:CreA family protein [Pelistega ratti]NEN75552.1 CreA family protein [Pelistega ratti]